MNIVTDYRGSKSDKKYAQRRNRKNYIRKTQVKFQDLEQKNSALCTIYWYSRMCGCGLQGHRCRVYGCVCHAG